MRVCVSLCTTVVHNRAQNSSDYFPSKPLDNRHSSDAVYWRGGKAKYRSSLTLLNATEIKVESCRLTERPVHSHGVIAPSLYLNTGFYSFKL